MQNEIEVGRAPSGQALAVPVEPEGGLNPTGFDPSRITLGLMMLSPGAKRALLKHTRDDGDLFESVLGADDAEELWFCSMQHLLVTGGRIVTRKLSGFGPHWAYRPTPLGYALRDTLRDSDGCGEADETAKTGSAEGDSAGLKGIATTNPRTGDQSND